MSGVFMRVAIPVVVGAVVAVVAYFRNRNRINPNSNTPSSTGERRKICRICQNIGGSQEKRDFINPHKGCPANYHVLCLRLRYETTKISSCQVCQEDFLNVLKAQSHQR